MVTEMAPHQSLKRRSVAAPTTPNVPSAAADAQRWAASSRMQAQRVLGRQRLRRRVIPPLVVGSSVLLGGSLSAAWVNGSLQANASASRQSTSLLVPASRAQTSEWQAIERVRQTMIADSHMIASLSEAALHALIANQKIGAANAAAAAAAASAGSAPIASGVSAPNSSGGAGAVALPALPSLPALAPMPSITLPATQGTTGASHVP